MVNPSSCCKTNSIRTTDLDPTQSRQMDLQRGQRRLMWMFALPKTHPGFAGQHQPPLMCLSKKAYFTNLNYLSQDSKTPCLFKHPSILKLPSNGTQLCFIHTHNVFHQLTKIFLDSRATRSLSFHTGYNFSLT